MEGLVKRLREGETVNKFVFANRTFYKVQLNKKNTRISWAIFASLDRKQWVKQYDHLSLKSVLEVLNNLNNL